MFLIRHVCTVLDEEKQINITRNLFAIEWEELVPESIDSVPDAAASPTPLTPPTPPTPPRTRLDVTPCKDFQDLDHIWKYRDRLSLSPLSTPPLSPPPLHQSIQDADSVQPQVVQHSLLCNIRVLCIHFALIGVDLKEIPYINNSFTLSLQSSPRHFVQRATCNNNSNTECVPLEPFRIALNK